MPGTYTDLRRLRGGGFSCWVHPHTSLPCGVLPRYSPGEVSHGVLSSPRRRFVSSSHHHQCLLSHERELSQEVLSRPKPVCVRFHVTATPVAQPRARVAFRRSRARGYTPDSRRVHAYKALIAIRYREAAHRLGLSGVQAFSAIALQFLASGTA